MSTLLPASAEDREPVLFAMLCDLDPGTTTMAEARRVIAMKTGLSDTSIKRYAGPNDWVIRWKREWDKKSGRVNLEEVDTALKSMLANRDDAVDKDVPFTKISSSLKDFSYLIIASNKNMVEVSSLMMTLYTLKAKRIMDRWRNSGQGLGQVSKTDQDLIESYMRKARGYYDFVGEWMKPSAVMAMLDQIGMKEAIGVLPEGTDPGAFTATALLKKLEEHAMTKGGKGLRSAIGDAELTEEIEASIQDVIGDIPEVNGRRVRDEENRINLDRPEDLKKPKP